MSTRNIIETKKKSRRAYENLEIPSRDQIGCAMQIDASLCARGTAKSLLSRLAASQETDEEEANANALSIIHKKIMNLAVLKVQLIANARST